MDRELDVNAIASVRGGIWQGREAPADLARAMRQQIEVRRAASPTAARERLSVVVDDLPVADRSAFAASARQALESHPGDPERAWKEFRHAGVNQYAGRDLDRPQREAVETVLATSPATVWEALRADYESYGDRELSGGLRGESTRVYDPRLMDPHGGVDEYRRDVQRSRAGNRPDDSSRPSRPG
jgi:hypothetical protein